MSDRPVRIVLDASAVTAFTQGSIDVGEVMAEVHDERATVGLPVTCLVEATRTVTDTDRLHILVRHDATVILADEPQSWQALAATYEIVGRLDAASAALTAIDRKAYVLTGQPGLYTGLSDGGRIIPL